MLDPSASDATGAIPAHHVRARHGINSRRAPSWRTHEPGAPWKALTLGTSLTIGGLTYKARPGVYDDF